MKQTSWSHLFQTKFDTSKLDYGNKYDMIQDHIITYFYHNDREINMSQVGLIWKYQMDMQLDLMNNVQNHFKIIAIKTVHTRILICDNHLLSWKLLKVVSTTKSKHFIYE